MRNCIGLDLHSQSRCDNEYAAVYPKMANPVWSPKDVEYQYATRMTKRWTVSLGTDFILPFFSSGRGRPVMR